MSTQDQAGFIAGKSRELETAILHSHSNCLLKFPDSIVKTMEVDNVGCVWLSVKKPMQYLHEFDRSFHVGLNYYKKGLPFFLNVLGVARLVIDPEEINQLSPTLQEEARGENLLIAVRILQANYYDNGPRQSQNPLKKWKQSIVSLFTGENNYYHFNMGDNKNYA